MLKLLMFFSPKVRLSNDLPTEQTVFSITAKEYAELTGLNIKGAYAALDRVVDALYNHSVIFHNEERGNVRTRLVTSTAYKEGDLQSVLHTMLCILCMSSINNTLSQSYKSSQFQDYCTDMD
jgi:hypothetical protein